MAITAAFPLDPENERHRQLMNNIAGLCDDINCWDRFTTFPAFRESTLLTSAWRE
uniref:Uncharacterized protein n=1 Tax=Physcomitrium patens TaxID=3218 RepID=A0A2K1J0G0_PHYPA|nr:hypothetical protein PHYPA_022910 [Physcomitrium patens]